MPFRTSGSDRICWARRATISLAPAMVRDCVWLAQTAAKACLVQGERWEDPLYRIAHPSFRRADLGRPSNSSTSASSRS